MASKEQTQQEAKLCQSHHEERSRCTVQKEKTSKRNNLVSQRPRPKPALYNNRKRGSSGAGPCFLVAQAESSSWDPPLPVELKQGCLPKHQDLIHRPQTLTPAPSAGTQTLSGGWLGERRARLGPCPGDAARRRPLPTPVPV